MQRQCLSALSVFTYVTVLISGFQTVYAAADLKLAAGGTTGYVIVVFSCISPRMISPVVCC